MGKRRTVRKADCSCLVSSDKANLTSGNTRNISVSSPVDWLSSIQTYHSQNNKAKASPCSPSLESIAEHLKSGHNSPELQIRLPKLNSAESKAPVAQDLSSGNNTPELQIRLQNLNSVELNTPAFPSPDDKDSVDNESVISPNSGESVISPNSGLKTSSFYGTKTKSFQFSFRKSPLDVNKKGVKKKQIRKNGKMGSLKRKHKSPKNSHTKNHAVKRSKKDEDRLITDEIKGTTSEDKFGIKDKEGEVVDNFNVNSETPGTILDAITPESSSSLSSEVEDIPTLKPNGIITECNRTDTKEEVVPPLKKENHIVNMCSKAVLDDVISELGSLHSDDSIKSGFGSVKSSALIKGQNGEYYFSNSNESSPDLTIKGPSKFFETPESTSPSSSPESELSSTVNSERTVLLFGSPKESDGSSYSPSIKSSKSLSPEERQTSITNYFKRAPKQANELGSPKTKKHDRLQRTNGNKKKEQMYLDLGQRNFGHVTCTTCGMVYTHAQPDDEIEHIRHHKKFVNGLRFNGWKDEHVVKEFSDGRIIMVKPDDHPSHQKKAEEIRKVVDSELGFAVDLPYKKKESKTFLFISNKRVVGCCVATQIDKGYPVLPSTPTKDSTPDRQIAAWCCSTVPVPAQCGISKIWVWNQYRRKRVATRLIESVRTHFIYGCIISKDVLAFSDPTPDGKRLATAYIGTPEFLVFH